MLVKRGSRYSIGWALFVFTRTMGAFSIEPVHASPFLSSATSYGWVHAVGTCHSLNCSVLVSNIAILLPRYCANQMRSCASIMPRRGPELFVGVENSFTSFVLASMRPIV